MVSDSTQGLERLAFEINGVRFIVTSSKMPLAEMYYAHRTDRGFFEWVHKTNDEAFGEYIFDPTPDKVWKTVGDCTAMIIEGTPLP